MLKSAVRFYIWRGFHQLCCQYSIISGNMYNLSLLNPGFGFVYCYAAGVVNSLSANLITLRAWPWQKVWLAKLWTVILEKTTCWSIVSMGDGHESARYNTPREFWRAEKPGNTWVWPSTGRSNSAIDNVARPAPRLRRQDSSTYNCVSWKHGKPPERIIKSGGDTPIAERAVTQSAMKHWNAQ